MLNEQRVLQLEVFYHNLQDERPFTQTIINIFPVQQHDNSKWSFSSLLDSSKLLLLFLMKFILYINVGILCNLCIILITGRSTTVNMMLILSLLLLITEAAVKRCSVKKVFLEVSQNSLENTFATVCFLIKSQATSGGCLYLYKDVICCYDKLATILVLSSHH